MERFVKGDVVVVPFPFSDLSGFKRRPALVAATIPGNDTILCKIGIIKETKAREVEEKLVKMIRS